MQLDSRFEKKTEELQQNQNHEKILFLTVLYFCRTQSALLVTSHMTKRKTVVLNSSHMNSNKRRGATSIFFWQVGRNLKLLRRSQVKLRGFECQTKGTYTKRAKQATKKDNAAACLYSLNYLAFLRPAADRAFPYFSGL
jgi:hypothetical protein